MRKRGRRGKEGQDLEERGRNGEVSLYTQVCKHVHVCEEAGISM